LLSLDRNQCVADILLEECPSVELQMMTIAQQLQLTIHFQLKQQNSTVDVLRKLRQLSLENSHMEIFLRPAYCRKFCTGSNVHKADRLIPENKIIDTSCCVLAISCEMPGMHETALCGMMTITFKQGSVPMINDDGAADSRFDPRTVIEEIPSSTGTCGKIADSMGAS
jgi:hypothetical protein